MVKVGGGSFLMEPASDSPKDEGATAGGVGGPLCPKEPCSVGVAGVPPGRVGVVPKEEAAGGGVVPVSVEPGVPKLEALGVVVVSDDDELLLLLAPPVGKSCPWRKSAPPHAQRASASRRRCRSRGISLRVCAPVAGAHG